ncbi:MAG: cache domain-containing protein, partial [Ignavibacteria bacterium]|nr:cache domain-containing protein [Ignavibacteria bacterium]
MLLLYLALIGIHPGAGHLGLGISFAVDGLIVGQMSPVTAFCFVLVGLSFLIILTKPGQKKLIKTSLIFAALVFFISIIFLLSYILGTPLLYEGAFIPLALTTSLAFLFLGIGLLLISGLKVWTYGELSNALSARYTYILVLVFIVLIVSIITTGYSYFKSYEKQFRFGTEQQLSSIASLKVNQIVQWRKERLNNAEFLFKNREFSGLINRLLKNQNDIDIKKRIQEWIDIVHSTYQYESISLHDLQGRELVTSPIRKIHSHIFFSKLLSEIRKSGEIVFKDFYRDENDLRIYLAIFIPIQFDNNLVGILDLRLDPQQYLYPLINEWPIQSKTAETLIVRREGNEVVFLNDLRLQKNTALNLRRPLTKLNLPAVRAALGKKEFIESVDHRGIPVLAYVCSIPDSPWFLVARIDKSEVYAPLREWFWAIIILVVGLLFGSGASVGFVWRNQRSKFHKERFETGETLQL